jgi:hypothetical protein
VITDMLHVPIAVLGVLEPKPRRPLLADQVVYHNSADVRCWPELTRILAGSAPG